MKTPKDINKLLHDLKNNNKILCILAIILLIVGMYDLIAPLFGISILWIVPGILYIIYGILILYSVGDDRSI